MKRILFVGNTAWSMYNFRGNLIKRLAQDYEVCVAAPFDAVFSDKIIALGAKFLSIEIAAKGTNPITDSFLTAKFVRLFKQEQVDFIFLYTIKPNIYGGVAARMCKIPFIAVTTGLGYTFVVDNMISRIARKLYKFSFKHAKQVWFLNKEDEADFLKYKLLDKKKSWVLHGEGVDTMRFALKSMPDKVSFLLMARMLWDKGVGDFVEAARIVKRKHPQIEFKLLGFLNAENPSAISEAQIKSWEKEGLVKYLGVTNNVVPYLTDATSLVLPSYYREGIPMTLLEAASMGRVLITTDNVGCRDTVDDNKTGFICPIKNVKMLAGCMLKLVEMKQEERISMGKAARDKVLNEFDEKRVFSAYLSALKQLN